LKTDHRTAVGKEPKPPDDQPFQAAVILKLGKRYLAKYHWLILAYIVATVACRPLLPIAAGLNLSQLTNFFQQERVTNDQNSDPRNNSSPSRTAIAGSQADRPPASAHSRANLLTTYLVWLLLSVAFVIMTGLLRYLTSLLDGKMANAMRIDVFNSILRQSPEFFFEYDADRLTMVVNQFCTQAQLGIRQLLLDPILQVSGVIIAGWTLYDQLVILQGAHGGTAWISFLVICLFALISPLLINSLGRFLQRESAAVQKSNLQLATLVGEPPSGDNWVHEIKYDGYRALCRISNGEVKLLTRSKNDWTKKFQSIADQMADLPIAMPSWTAKSLAPRNRARRRSKPCSKP